MSHDDDGDEVVIDDDAEDNDDDDDVVADVDGDPTWRQMVRRTVRQYFIREGGKFAKATGKGQTPSSCLMYETPS